MGIPLKKIDFFAGLALAFVFASPVAGGQTADQAWLKYLPIARQLQVPYEVRASGNSVVEQSAVAELVRGLSSLAAGHASADSHGAIVLGTSQEFHALKRGAGLPHLAPEEFLIQWAGTAPHRDLEIIGGSDRGALYGAFELLRMEALGQSVPPAGVREAPAMPIRWTDEWDNPDGSIERGYAGRSIFFDNGHVRQNLAPVTEYARLLASVGINGCDVNNVNAAPVMLQPEVLKELARVADAMRPWGVRMALSVDLAGPQKIGGLATYDPLDPAVKKWWNNKVDEIYALIPDFAGFTVKADSEGQPGPASFGRSPADAANTLAAALAPHGGVVMYRAFVYNHHLDWRDPKADRARAAYDIFHPLDGDFAPNVVVQIKYGPIDFQVREPVSPLFGGLEKTNDAMEVQVTQEYTGQQRHLVYLAPMWKGILDFDMRVGNRATPVKDLIAGRIFHRPLGGMVAVTCVGQDAWLGSPLAMANLYAFGRLAWDPNLSADKIAAEWAQQTLSADPVVVNTLVKMLMQSWPAYEDYTGPLGLQTLTDITGSHYGPNVEASERNGWGQWHRADREGVGMDRTVATGTGFTSQYPPEVAKIYESLKDCPDNLLLFFHHVPYTYRLHEGKTVIQYLYDSHYQGAEQAAGLVREWNSLKGRIDPRIFAEMRARLVYQAGHAIVWRDAICQYFLKLSGIPDDKGRVGHYPGRLEAEDARLDGYKVIDVNPWEDASGGKAVSCVREEKNALGQPGGWKRHQPGEGDGLQPVLEQSAKSAVLDGLVSGHDLSRAANASISMRALAPEGTLSRSAEIPAGLKPHILESLDVRAEARTLPTSQQPEEWRNAGAGKPAACSAEWTYSGPVGRYDIAAQYFDLQGGVARFALDVNGRPVASWAADANLPSSRPNGDNSTRYTACGVDLKPGDTIRVEGTPDGSDPAALDYIQILRDWPACSN
jgi:alpha-glucuronidase